MRSGANVTLSFYESVQYPGWDGLCEAEEGADYVPLGASAWEIGAQRTVIRPRADSDYEKRSKDPLGVVPAEATFVFVTPQRFVAKAAWRMGISEEDSHRLPKGSGRSLAVLRRLVPAASTFLPRWAAEPPTELIAAMLAGSWNETSVADRKIIAAVAGRTYEQVEESLTALTTGPEAPLLRSGPIWKLVSLRDAWTVLAPRLTTTQLQRFETAFQKVLSTRNPRFHLAGRETCYERKGQFGEEVSPSFAEVLPKP